MTIKKFIAGAIVFAFSAFAVAGVANAAYMHSVTLKLGSSNSQVMSLQQTLNMTPCIVGLVGTAGGPGTESMYFGPKTLGAVKCFQTANNLASDGIVGPATGAKLQMVVGGGSGFPAGCSSTSGYSTVTGQPCNSGGSLPAGCTSTSGYSPTTGQSCSGGGSPSTGLSGTDGTIDDITKISSYNNEDVGQGQDDVKVFGFEVETSNDGDVRLRSIKLVLDSTGNTGSDNLDDYITGVTVWMGDTKVGSADVDDFSEDSDVFTRVISLNNAVVGSDDTEKFYVSVDAVNNFDSGDITGDSWTIALENVRFEDGSGVVSTEVSAIATDIYWDAAGDGVTMDFVSFSSAADTEVVFSAANDSPEAGIVIIDGNDSVTDDVVLLKGEIEVEGDSDVVIDSLPFTFSPTTDNFNVIADSVTLIIDGEEYSESVPSIAAAASASITFDNLDLTVDAGDTIDFEIRINVNGDDDVTAGATVTASFTSSNRDVADIENEEGDQLSDSSEKSGTATGEAQEFRPNGISLSLVSTNETVVAGSSNDDDVVTFTIKYKIAAVGDDVYVSSLASAQGHVYAVQRSGTATTGGVSAVVINNTDTDLTAVGNYLIEEGEEETFTLTISVAPGQDGLYRAVLSSIKWSTTDEYTLSNTYSSNMDNFVTDYTSIN